ncbi:MAG: hypothetical protein ACOX6O_05385 [Christensenellales bacterium]
MKIRKYLCWLLVLALALSLPTAGLAETTERIYNADGSYVWVRTNDASLTTRCTTTKMATMKHRNILMAKPALSGKKHIMKQLKQVM